MKFNFYQKRANRTIRARSAIEALLSECRIDTPLLINSLQEKWSKIVNVIVASHSRPERIYKNVLYIAADHPAYSNEIMMMKGMIIEKLNKDLGFNDVKDLRIEVKRLKW